MPNVNRPTLLALLRKLRGEAGSDVALAKRLHVSSNHIPRLLSDTRPTVPSLETCLRIAREARLHPSQVLLMAGYDDLVPFLEASYNVTGGVSPASDPGAVAQDDDEVYVLVTARRFKRELPDEWKAWLAHMAARLRSLQSEQSPRPGKPSRPRLRRR